MLLPSFATAAPLLTMAKWRVNYPLHLTEKLLFCLFFKTREAKLLVFFYMYIMMCRFM